MSDAIREFVEQLRNWRKCLSFKDYDYNNYNCEISELIKFCKTSESYSKKEMEKIFDFWSDKFVQPFFELKHPEFNYIDTRAVFSVKKNTDSNLWGNCVFMIDKNNSFPWMLLQMYHLGTAIVTQNNIYRPYFSTKEELCLIDDFVKEYDEKNIYQQLMHRDELFCVDLSGPRPYHYFEHLSSFLPLLKKNQYFRVAKHSFFFPEKLQRGSEQNLKIYPCVFGRDGLIHQRLFASCVNEVIQESLSRKVQPKNELDYDLIVWLGLPGERRAWLEQIEGTANILKHCNKYFKKIKVYIDGMTGYDGQIQDFSENKMLFNKIVNTTRELFLQEYNKNIIFTFEELQKLVDISTENEEKIVVFKSLAGYDYRTKICYCRDCDITISDSGTTALVPFQFHKKPGVVFYGELASFYINFSKSLANNAYQRAVDEKLVVQANRKSFLVWDYHIPYQHVYNLAAEVLEELSRDNKLKVKNLKMHRLEVPPVELIAKQYELEKQFEVKIPLENVEFVDKLATQLQQKDQIIQTKNQELASKNQEITQTKNQLDSTKQQLDSKVKELSSLPIKKQTLEIKNLEQDLINKQLHTKQLEKELGYESNVLKELELKNQELIQTKNQLDFTKKQLDSKTKELESKNKILESNPNPSHLIQNTPHFKGKLAYLNTLTTAKDRIHNHLSYKLGQAMIENSKSLLGYIRMPYVLSYIKEQHNKEQKQYQEQIKKNPNLKLPNLESYPDYKEALKEKECFTYKLGEALMKADKTWYKGGYVKLWFEVRRLKGERK